MADVARRLEASLTSGVVPWNRFPSSFKRVHSSKRSSRNSTSPPPVPRSPTPKLQLQPHKTAQVCGGMNRSQQESRDIKKKSIIVTLPSDSGAVRPKSANFPARNFLAGYRQIHPRGTQHREIGDDDSDRLSHSSSILMLSPSHGNPGIRQDLDQMDDAELNQIFEELTAADDEDNEIKERIKDKNKSVKIRLGIHPEATATSEETVTTSEEALHDANLEVFPPQMLSDPQDNQSECYNGARTTPTSFRTMSAYRSPSSSKLTKSGQIVHSNDNLMYVPRPKTRLCRVYVGSTVVKPTNSGRPLEFLPVNRQANLHSRSGMRSRPCSGKPERPVQYSTNFGSSYDLKHVNGYPFVHPSTPEPDCIMCQHYLQR